MKKVHICNRKGFSICSDRLGDNYISRGAMEMLNAASRPRVGGVRFHGVICQHCLKTYIKLNKKEEEMKIEDVRKIVEQINALLELRDAVEEFVRARKITRHTINCICHECELVRSLHACE